MRHIWSVICRFAFEDKESQNYSLVETLSRVSFKGDIPEERPVILPFSYRIVSLWHRGNALRNQEHTVRLRIIAPEYVEVASAVLKVELTQEEVVKTIFNSETFQYTSDGIYEFEISYLKDEKWVVATQVPLKVSHKQSQSVPPESEPTV